MDNAVKQQMEAHNTPTGGDASEKDSSNGLLADSKVIKKTEDNINKKKRISSEKKSLERVEEIREAWKEKAKLQVKMESKILEDLTEQDCSAIEKTLEIMESSKSIFLINLFKSATSVAEIECSKLYQVPIFNFEAEKTSWSLAGWSEMLQSKLKIGISSDLPTFFRKWLDELRERRRLLS